MTDDERLRQLEEDLKDPEVRRRVRAYFAILDGWDRRAQDCACRDPGCGHAAHDHDGAACRVAGCRCEGWQ